MPRTTICETCHGTGQRHLSEVEGHTLAAVGPRWSTRSEIGVRLEKLLHREMAPGSVCNRLTDLLALGLIERRPLGNRPSVYSRPKSYEWRVKP